MENMAREEESEVVGTIGGEAETGQQEASQLAAPPVPGLLGYVTRSLPSSEDAETPAPVGSSSETLDSEQPLRLPT